MANTNTNTTANGTQVTLTITDELMKQVQELLKTRPNSTVQSLLESCLMRGIQDRAYRTSRNREQYQAFKEWKALSKQGE